MITIHSENLKTETLNDDTWQLCLPKEVWRAEYLAELVQVYWLQYLGYLWRTLSNEGFKVRIKHRAAIARGSVDCGSADESFEFHQLPDFWCWFTDYGRRSR